MHEGFRHKGMRWSFRPAWLLAAVLLLAWGQPALATPELRFADGAPDRYVLGSGTAINFVVDGELPDEGDVLALAWSHDEERMVHAFAHTYQTPPWRIPAEHLDQLPVGRVQIQLHQRLPDEERDIVVHELEVLGAADADGDDGSGPRVIRGEDEDAEGTDSASDADAEAGAAAAPSVGFPSGTPGTHTLGSTRDIGFAVDGTLPEDGDVLVLAWSHEEQRVVDEFAHTHTAEPWIIAAERLNELPPGGVQLQLHRRMPDAERTIARHEIVVEAPRSDVNADFPSDAPAAYRHGSGQAIEFEVDGTLPDGVDVLALAWSASEERMVDAFAATFEEGPWRLEPEQLDRLPVGDAQLQLHLRVPGADRTVSRHEIEILPALPEFEVGFDGVPSTYQQGSGQQIDLRVSGELPADGDVLLLAWSEAQGEMVDAFAHTLEGEPWRIAPERLDVLPSGDVMLEVHRRVPNADRTAEQQWLEIHPADTDDPGDEEGDDDAETEPGAPTVSFGTGTPSTYQQGSGQAISFHVDGELPEDADILALAWSDAEGRVVDEFAHSFTQEPWRISAERMDMLPTGGTSLQLLVRLPDADDVRVDTWMTIEPAAPEDDNGDTGDDDGDTGDDDGDTGDDNGDTGDDDGDDDGNPSDPGDDEGDPGDDDGDDTGDDDGDPGDDEGEGDYESAGWTQFDPANAARIIYVSSSEGDDANDGRSPENPVASISRGRNLVRSGTGDWMLLKAGDEWHRPGRFAPWSGASAERMAKMGVYGEGPRPVLRGGEFRAAGNMTINHFAIVGIEFYNSGKDPNSPDYRSFSTDTAIIWRCGGENILIEDTVVRFYRVGIAFEGRDDVIRDVALRRSIVTDQYSTGSGHANGVYFRDMRGLLIEDNVFDHNGWHATVSDSTRTIFNHNIYVQHYNTDVVVRNNIVARGGASGAMIRAGGLVEDNLMYANPLNLVYGANNYPYPAQAKSGAVRRNVIIDSDDIAADLRRGTGILFSSVRDVMIEENIIAHRENGSGSIRALNPQDESDGVTIRRNHVWGWGGRDFNVDTSRHRNFSGVANVIDGHRFNGPYYDGSGATNIQYADPSRHIDSYVSDELGRNGGAETLLQIARERPRGHWNPAHAATPVIAHVRSGFNVLPSYD